MSLSDILAALGGCLDATTQAILAMSFGFAMIPCAFCIYGRYRRLPGIQFGSADIVSG